jgi:hypothetical protein
MAVRLRSSAASTSRFSDVALADRHGYLECHWRLRPVPAGLTGATFMATGSLAAK